MVSSSPSSSDIATYRVLRLLYHMLSAHLFLAHSASSALPYALHYAERNSPYMFYKKSTKHSRFFVDPVD